VSEACAFVAGEVSAEYFCCGEVCFVADVVAVGGLEDLLFGEDVGDDHTHEEHGFALIHVVPCSCDGTSCYRGADGWEDGSDYHFCVVF